MRISDWSSDVCSSDLDPAQHLEAGQHVEAAVEPTPVRNGVDVAADQDGALRLPGQRRPLVSRLVDLDLDRESGQLVAHPSTKSDARSVGNEGVSSCRYRGSPQHKKTKHKIPLQ